MVRIVELDRNGESGRRYRFAESPWMPPGQFLLATTANTVWPGPPPVLRPGDDLLVLFHPDMPDAIVGRLVNEIRDRGDTVEVERTPR